MQNCTALTVQAGFAGGRWRCHLQGSAHPGRPASPAFLLRFSGTAGSLVPLTIISLQRSRRARFRPGRRARGPPGAWDRGRPGRTPRSEHAVPYLVANPWAGAGGPAALRARWRRSRHRQESAGVAPAAPRPRRRRPPRAARSALPPPERRAGASWVLRAAGSRPNPLSSRPGR